MEQAVASDKKQKTSKSRRESAVQGTNDNSIVSKCSMSAAGYFDDPFLKHFVAKASKRAPLINRGYYLRAVCVDQMLRQFLTRDPGVRKQIVSLGAGFDSTYFRLKANNLLENSSFYEIDFPEVTKRKNAIIQSNSELKNLLSLDGQDNKVVPPIELSTRDYNLLGVDLTQLNTLEAALRMCGADFDLPTLLLSECVVTYMTRRCSSALVKWAGETFQDALFVMFEQINPDDAFGCFMQNHFHTVGSPLKCITSFPTVESQIKRFVNLGWKKCKCHDLNELYRHMLSTEERARMETLDPFDEYEEFNLKCAHYFLLVASTRSSFDDFLRGLVASLQVDVTQHPTLKEGYISLSNVPAPQQLSIKRFSHSSILVSGRFIVTTGGFGEVDGRHQRVQEVSVTDTATMETMLVRCHSDDLQYSRMHHSSVVLSDGRILLYGGRQSPFFLCSQALVVRLKMDGALNFTDVESPQHVNFKEASKEKFDDRKGNMNNDRKRVHSNGTTNFPGLNVSHSDYPEADDTNVNNLNSGDNCTNHINMDDGEKTENTNSLDRSGRVRNYDSDITRNYNSEMSRNSDSDTSRNNDSVARRNGDSNTRSDDSDTSRNDDSVQPEFDSRTNCAVPENDPCHAAAGGAVNCKNHFSAIPVSSPSPKHNLSSSETGDRNDSALESNKGSKCCKTYFSESPFPLDKLPLEKEETTNFERGSFLCSVYTQSGDIPCPRWRHAVTTVKFKGNESVFLHGGRTQKAEVLGDTFWLDVKTGAWTKVECQGDNPGALHSHTMVTWQAGGTQQVVLVGGMNGDQCPQNSVYILDVDTLTWKQVSISGVLLPRYSHTCHLIDDRLVVVGGVNLLRHTPGLAVVNLHNGHAQEFAFPPVMKDQLLMFHRHCSVYLSGGRLVILGGGGNCFSFGTHLNNTPVVMDISKCLEPSA